MPRRGLWADPDVVQNHRPRPAGVYADTRLQIYFHPDDAGRNILLADPFVHFESPQHAAAAGYRPSMDYAAFVRREQRFLTGSPLRVTTGSPVGGARTGSPGTPGLPRPPGSFKAPGASGSSPIIVESAPPSAYGFKPGGSSLSPYAPRP